MTGHTEQHEAGECAFADCPPGLFRWQGLLCFKSEYSTRARQPDAYCVDSGEYFWGGTNGDLEKRQQLIVTPLAPTPNTEPASGWQQEQVEAVRDAADLLHGYGEYIAQVHSSELERHPYLPAVEDVIARLRALAALTQPSGERP